MTSAVAAQGLVYNRIHQTTPLLVHAPGKIAESPWWGMIKAAVLAAPRSSDPQPSIAIVTWNSGAPSTHMGLRGHTLGSFERSLDRQGISYVVLGQNVGAAWTNRMKLALTLEFLTRTDADVVLGADSSDALLIGPARELLGRFLSQEAELLFNAEKNHWPPIEELERFETGVARGPFRYLNSGVWIGRRSACLRAFEAAARWSDRLTTHPRGDQICWKYAYRDLYPSIQVDWRCALFQCLHRTQREISVGGRRYPPSVTLLQRITGRWGR